ncbi:hypothetical protein ACFPRH_29225, partial [Streptomyces amakusaensis]
FPSVLRFQLYQILFPFRFRFGFSDPAASWTGLLPFGCSDFIRIISAELIGLRDPDKESIGSAGIQFPLRARETLSAALDLVQSEATV